MPEEVHSGVIPEMRKPLTAENAKDSQRALRETGGIEI